VAGADLYRLHCVSCHGDQLLGLTPEYIALWPLEDQNCWKSKCHGAGHPNPQDGGFELPREIPAISGPGALGKFRSAAGLFAFVRARMPYQDPQWLKDDEYWAVVAYILNWNGLALPEELGPDNAGEVIINALTVDPQVEATPPPPTGGGGVLPAALGLAVLLAFVLVVVLVVWRRVRAHPS
jgi:mono/diheme cytochrome c family protein